MLDRRFRSALVTALLAALGLFGGVTIGQAQDEDPPEAQQPVLASAAADCHDGTAGVKVWIDDSPRAWVVAIDGLSGDFRKEQTSTFDEERGMYVALFSDVPVGEYEVVIAGAGNPSDGLRVVVKDCKTPGPAQGGLGVEVECRAGWGIATFQVANPATGEVTSYTVTVGGQDEFVIPTLAPGLFVRITQNLYDDGSYVARLEDEDHTVVARKEFTVACAQGNAPKLDVTTTCDGATGLVKVGVLNPNRPRIEYTVTLGKQSKAVAVLGGVRAEVSFAGVADGRHRVTVTGNDTRADATVTVDCVKETTTPPPTTTTTPATTTAPATTTTAPAPQGGSGGGLATTGAAVGGMVGLGALVLGLGGALLMLGRRRRAHRD